MARSEQEECKSQAEAAAAEGAAKEDKEDKEEREEREEREAPPATVELGEAVPPPAGTQTAAAARAIWVDEISAGSAGGDSFWRFCYCSRAGQRRGQDSPQAYLA